MNKFDILLTPNIYHDFLPIPNLPANVSVNNLNSMVSPSFLTLREGIEFEMNIRVSIFLPYPHHLALEYFALYFIKDDGTILDRLPIEFVSPHELVPPHEPLLNSQGSIQPPNYFIAPITQTFVIQNPQTFRFKTLPLPGGVSSIEFFYRIIGVLTLFWDECSTQTGLSIPFSFDPKLKITTGGPHGDGIGG